MTAEIAILNKSAVALAVDSAVTTGTEGKEKIFNSANKLFRLSKYHPIGVMIFGHVDFLGIPWETIIKLYRKKIKDKSFDTIRDCADDFASFVESGLQYDPKEESVSAAMACQPALALLRTSVI